MHPAWTGQTMSKGWSARSARSAQSCSQRHAGCGLAIALILDDMSARRMWGRQMVNYRTGRVVSFGADRGVAAQWIVANYGPQVALPVFRSF